ncbi:hypothetical protein PybrP1_000764, partial [[Pythium] brassicae (nom. inval.)]
LASLQCRERGVLSSIRRADDEPVAGLSNSTSADAPAPEARAHAAAMAVEFCKKVRYVRLSREKARATLQAEIARAEAEAREQLKLQELDPEERELPKAHEPLEIEARAASSMELQEFFETFAETSRPVLLLRSEPGAAASAQRLPPSNEHPLLGFTNDSEWTQFRTACFAEPASGEASERVRSAPLRIRDAACAAHLERFRVPLFLVHDYVRRTNVSLSDAYLPSLVRAQASGVSPPPGDAVVSCPHGLHMLALVLSAAGDGDGASQPPVGMQTFDKRLQPFLEKRDNASRVQEVALSAASGGAVDLQDAHYSEGQSESAWLPRIAPLHQKREIGADSFVFVPGNQFAVVRPPRSFSGDSDGGHEDSTSGPSDMQQETAAALADSAGHTVPLLRFCFVDASNFNAVKQEVALEALVDGHALTLLQSLQSHAFDRSMFRRPQAKDTFWSSFLTWPKETKLLKKSDLDSSELQLSRRERLKQWQDDKRWDRHVEALTLPVSLPPVVVNTTRTTATLRFQDLYEPLKHDITAYGYVVRWRNIDDELVLAAARSDRVRDTSEPRGDAESEPPPLSVNEMNVTRRHLMRSALPTTLFGDDFDGKDIEVVVRGLSAETRYAFSVQIYVDDTSGLESDSSRIVQTAPCSEPGGVRGVPTASELDSGACATLRWLGPADDGGKPVRLFLVSARIVNGDRESSGTAADGAGAAVATAVAALAGSHNATRATEDEKVFALDARFAARHAGGKWRSAAVCTLLVPGSTYLFRVAAMNSIGAGPWSSPSDPVELPPSASHHAQIGVAATSRRSLSASVGSTVVPTLKGRGDPHYVPMRAFSMRELADLVAAHGSEAVIATVAETEDPQRPGGVGPAVLLSDVIERIVVSVASKFKIRSEGETQPELTPDAAASSTTANANPEQQQQLAFDVWASHFSPRAFHVSAEMVRAEPLDASTPLRNAAQVKDRVVLVARGGVPFVFKAHYAQAAGALGIVIADVNDSCHGRFDQQCVPGGDKSRGEGFAAQDRHALWEQNRIPCVLVLHADAHRLLELVPRE